MSDYTPRQTERRQRVVQAALDLASAGGYEAVQMRDVAAEADVALGTLYRYFTSKDHLLAAAMIDWMQGLDAVLEKNPPRGETTAERVTDVLGRALRAMEQEPQLSAAVIAALTAADEHVGQAQREVTALLYQIMGRAFPAGADPDEVASLAKILAHVWFSSLVGWVNGLGDIAWVLAEIRSAAQHVLPAGPGRADGPSVKLAADVRAGPRSH